jgi:uncharacterized coiled-coil DUF342 family protein
MRACLEAVRTERDHLTARVAELEERTNTKDKENVRLNESIQATRACLEAVRTERDHLTARVAELEEMLQKTRLWVGQLSQDLAACKRRQ